MYLDDNLFAQGVSDGLTRSEYYFYNIERNVNEFKLFPKSNLSDGYHTWKIIAFSHAGVSADSDTWRFYIDSVDPFIKLTSVDRNRLNWDTRTPSSIPTLERRYLYTSANPLLTGETEPGVNLQYTLLCPIGVTSCTSPTETYNYPNGKFQHRFYNLLPNKTYSVYLATTDAAGNFTILPVFYLIYLSGQTVIFPPPATITPPIIPTTPPSIPSELPTIEEVPYPELIIPTQFLPIPPAAPTPPPTSYIEPIPTDYSPIFFTLLIFGLPLHLLLTQFATATKISLTHKFLFILFFPFLRRRKYTTHPFTTVEIHNAQSNHNHIGTEISDVLGHYSLSSEDLPQSLFIKATHRNRYFKPSLVPGKIFSSLCLYLLPIDQPSTLQRLQTQSMTIRSLPLGIGLLTSCIALIFIPSYVILFYFYLCLQAAFSEYIYPKLTH